MSEHTCFSSPCSLESAEGAFEILQFLLLLLQLQEALLCGLNLKIALEFPARSLPSGGREVIHQTSFGIRITSFMSAFKLAHLSLRFSQPIKTFFAVSLLLGIDFDERIVLGRRGEFDGFRGVQAPPSLVIGGAERFLFAGLPGGAS